ncbi:hypothetical protein [Streptomyces adonidis]|uniref:hypothetical protein n=1 Tax=Streptomyces adonidis TaxID=3231367 RepID=UPI0034DB42CC
MGTPPPEHLDPDTGSYVTLAGAAARWDRVSGRLGQDLRARLVALLTVVRDPRQDTRARHFSAAKAAGLLGEALPDEFGAGGHARLVAVHQAAGRPPTVQGFTAEDFAVLLLDGHRMVGPILGPVRERLLAEPALDADEVQRGGGSPHSPDLIRLPGPGGRLRLPRFQFSEDALPWLPVLEVNALLDADHDPWGVADWWLSANAWLGGTSPVRLLGTGRDRQLVETARFLMESD